MRRGLVAQRGRGCARLQPPARSAGPIRVAMSSVISGCCRVKAGSLRINVPIAGMAMLPVLFGWPALLYPMHIALLELIIDPAC